MTASVSASSCRNVCLDGRYSMATRVGLIALAAVAVAVAVAVVAA